MSAEVIQFFYDAIKSMDPDGLAGLVRVHVPRLPSLLRPPGL